MRLLLALVILATTPLMAQYRPDILGSDFEQRTIPLERDYSGEVSATLVRRVPRVESDRAILYIHGYNDYFFQSEMAERFQDSMYNFYALDLRKYGRSLRPDQTPFEVRDMSEYFAEIDSALVIMRGEGVRKVTLLAHSTGGLTTPLYCNARRESDMIDGLILNSPFFDMNLGWALEEFGIPAVSFLGALMPDLVVLRDSSSAYYKSLLKEYNGEWEYDTNLKKSEAEPTRAGWVRAIHLAQKELQRGLNLSIPILVMHSDKSLIAMEWSEECQTSDIVLDVKDIAQYSSALGNNSVTTVEIKDGMHDLILSGSAARERAYRAIFEWLRNYARAM